MATESTHQQWQQIRNKKMYHQVCFVLLLVYCIFSLLTLVHKHFIEEEQNDDPGIIIVYNDAIVIHQVLQLPSVANIRPVLQPGANAAQSKLNLIHWMDDLVILSAKGDHCLVYTASGVKETGLYQQLGQAEHLEVHGKLSALRQLRTECDTNGISAGRYYTVCPAGEGRLTIINIENGPFLN